MSLTPCSNAMAASHRWIRANEYLLHHSIPSPDTVRLGIKGTLFDVSTPGINDGNFHHIAWVRYSTGTNELYVEGMLKGSGALPTGPLVIDPNGLWLGQEQDCLGGCFDSGQAFTGLIDEVAIYNRRLTAAEIKGIYDLGIGQ